MRTAGGEMFGGPANTASHHNAVLILWFALPSKAFAGALTLAFALVSKVGEELLLLTVVGMGQLFVTVSVERWLIWSSLAVRSLLEFVMFEDAVGTPEPTSRSSRASPPHALSPAIPEISDFGFGCSLRFHLIVGTTV